MPLKREPLNGPLVARLRSLDEAGAVAKKLIAIEVNADADDARVLALANAVWELTGQYLGEDAYVCTQGFDAPGWDDSDVTIRVSAPKVRSAR